MDGKPPRALEDDEIEDLYIEHRRYANIIKEARPGLVSKISPQIIEQLDAGKHQPEDFGEGSDTDS